MGRTKPALGARSISQSSAASSASSPRRRTAILRPSTRISPSPTIAASRRERQPRKANSRPSSPWKPAAWLRPRGPRARGAMRPGGRAGSRTGAGGGARRGRPLGFPIAKQVLQEGPAPLAHRQHGLARNADDADRLACADRHGKDGIRGEEYGRGEWLGRRNRFDPEDLAGRALHLGRDRTFHENPQRVVARERGQHEGALAVFAHRRRDCSHEFVEVQDRYALEEGRIRQGGDIATLHEGEYARDREKSVTRVTDGLFRTEVSCFHRSAATEPRRSTRWMQDAGK